MEEKQKKTNGIPRIFESTGLTFFLLAFFFIVLSWPYASFLNGASTKLAVVYFFSVWIFLALVILISAVTDKK